MFLLEELPLIVLVPLEQEFWYLGDQRMGWISVGIQ
jgi:hypothetical protein